MLKLVILIALGLMIVSCGQESSVHSVNTLPKGAQGMTLVDSDFSGVTFSNDIEEDKDHFYFIFNYVYNGGGVAAGRFKQ